MKTRLFLKSQQGTIFLTTMIIMFLMVLVSGSVFQLSTQHMHYISVLRKSSQAQYLAEAGLAAAVATLTANFSNKDNAAMFPATNLGVGSYDVTVVQSGGRVLLKSVGTVQSVQRLASLEVEDLTPTALNQGEAAGGNILLATILGSDSDVTGNLFANQNVNLIAWFFSSVTINGDVFAGGTVSKSTFFGGTVTWWSKTDNAGNITFPNYDFNFYKAIAQTNELANPGCCYFLGNQDWTNKTSNLNTTGGVLFVEGNVTLRGTTTITGCLISTGTVRMYGTVNQSKAVNFPSYPAMMTSTNDILLLNIPFISSGKLFANGLVYAGNDFKLLGIGAQANVTGSVIAKGVLQQAQIVSDLDIVYVHQNPPGLIIGGGATAPINVKSYNT